MSPDDAATLVRTCVHEIAPEADVASLPPEADMRDTLHLDSLDFLQVVGLLSSRSGVRIDENDYPRLATLASTVDFLTAATR
jgi:acyl carrier protein